jgi:hypothetical protein
MMSLKRLIAPAAVGGALLFGVVAAVPAQQDAGPKIDVDRLVAELGLPDAVKADLNKLNDLLARRARVREEAVEINSGMSDVWSSALAQLTPDQRRELRSALRDHGMAGRMGRHMGGGMRGAGHSSGCGGVGGMGSMDMDWMGHGSGMGRGADMGHRFRN